MKRSAGDCPGARGAVLAALLRTGSSLTGRQVHGLVRDQFSLWSVQQARTSLVGLGVVESRAVGRAMVRSINEDHYAVEPPRVLLDPFATLREAVRGSVGSGVDAVILFGSVARGEEPVAAGDAIHAGICTKADVEYGVTLVPAAKAEALLRRTRGLVELAVRIVRLNG